MYIFLCSLTALLTYTLYICLNKNETKFNERFKHIVFSLLISMFLTHTIIFLLNGNVNMSYELNNITTSFIIKYIGLSLIVAITSSLLIYFVFDNFDIKIVKNDKRKNIKSTIINFILFIFLVILFFSVKYFIDYYSNVPVEQLTFHLQVPLEGTSSSVINDFINKSLVPSLLIIIFFGLIVLPVTKYKIIFQKSNKKEATIFPLNFHLKIITYLIIIAIISLIVYCMKHYDVVNFVKSQFISSEFVEKNYVSPKDVEINFPSKKQNLIYIYLESMESTYMSKENGGVLDNNLIPNLYKLAEKEINFSATTSVGGLNETVGSNCTIASMVAQTSGLPLKFSVDSSSYNVENKSFLSGVITLGDILDKEGYKNYLYIGSDASFAGRDLYFEQHGNYEIFDYNQANKENKIDSDYYVWWGYEDKKLYEFSKEKLLEISKNEEPFNFTMLTVDTHPTGGYLDETCETKYEENIENAISCSDEMIIDFTNWIRKQDFYENTTIIIVGDHLNMDSSFIKSNNERYVYNVVINPSIKPKNEKNRKATLFDMFPTTLASLGVEIEGDKLGLGTNLFSGSKTLNEKYGIDKINEELKKKSTFYQDLSLYQE